MLTIGWLRQFPETSGNKKTPQKNHSKIFADTKQVVCFNRMQTALIQGPSLCLFSASHCLIGRSKRLALAPATGSHIQRDLFFFFCFAFQRQALAHLHFNYFHAESSWTGDTLVIWSFCCCRCCLWQMWMGNVPSKRKQPKLQKSVPTNPLVTHKYLPVWCNYSANNL